MSEMSPVDVLRELKRIAGEAFDAWDADRDSRVGKMLLALAGNKPGYRADIDALHASLAARQVAQPGPAALLDALQDKVHQDGPTRLAFAQPDGRALAIEECAQKCDELAEMATRLHRRASSSFTEGAVSHGQIEAFRHAADAIRALPSEPAEDSGDTGHGRPCTCHPDDNPPRPCPKKYALTDCRAAAVADRSEVK